MKIAIVGNSAAAKNQLGRLAETLRGRGAEVSTLLRANEGATQDEIHACIKDATRIVVGMAPSREAAQIEIDTLYGAPAGAECYPYADTFGAVARPWFIEAAQRLAPIRGIFVPTESEAKLAGGGLYPNAQFYVVGNPEWWSSRIPSMGKQEARALLGAKAGEIVILYGGTKQELADLHILGQLVNACLAEGVRTRILYTIHPGTSLFGPGKVDEQAAQMILGRIMRVPQNRSDLVTAVVAPKGVSTEVVQCAADIVAESLSATGMTAVVRRQPVISFLTPMMEEHLCYLQGDTRYPLIAQGASAKASDSPKILGKMIANFLGHEAFRKHQVEAQERFVELDRDPCEAMADILLRQ